MNTFEVDSNILKNGVNICELLVITCLTKSKGEGRRLIEQGGIFVDDNKVDDFAQLIKADKEVVIRKGQKVFLKVVCK